MRAFVTGATGLLGSNLVRELAAQGHTVRALVRSQEKAASQLGDVGNVELIVGDMGDTPAFASALENCDVLFHTAAYFREYYAKGNVGGELERINVTASVRLFEEAARRGIRRGIFTSSSGTIGRKPDGSPGDEDTPPAEIATSNAYFRSKVLAERTLNELAGRAKIEIVHILPGLMFGPGDAAPTGAGKVVLDFLARKLPGVPDGGSNMVDARDVARAMVAAAVRGRAGARYIVAGENRTIGEVFATLERVSGVAAPKRRLPYALSLVVAWFTERVARLQNREASLSVAGVRSIHARLHATSERACGELGATFRPFDETMRDTVAWFREHGYCDSKSEIKMAAA